MFVAVAAGSCWVADEAIAVGACLVREALRARLRDDERGGTLPGGMLYMLETLWLSTGLDGDGVLEDRPRYVDLPPLLSMLFFLSGSRFSPHRVSVLGRRFDAADAFRIISGRDVFLGRLLSDRSLCGIVSTRLGSVSSRMSDKGRTFAHEGACKDGARGSPKELLIMPPPPVIRLPSGSGDATNEEPLTRSKEGRVSEYGPAPGCDCE